jgi:hypothetical protein
MCSGRIDPGVNVDGFEKGECESMGMWTWVSGHWDSRNVAACWDVDGDGAGCVG